MTARWRLELRGQVQGVGFRPFVYRLAAARRLGGYVANDSNGAVVEVEGPPAALATFEHDLHANLPPLAFITRADRRVVEPLGEATFRIRASRPDPARRPEVTPDAATCADCRRELFDPADRRHRYPFINCTNCGPRYSIIRGVPYDRPKTTMADFQMCAACQREYDSPSDRRFHAQPNACPACGPQVRLHVGDAGTAGGPVSDDPIRAAAALLLGGAIVAIKGLGGYHLACRADGEDVVQRLRQRKLRDGKPLAIMVGDVAAARRICALTAADEQALASTAAPIVLARKAGEHGVAPSVAPGCRDFGVMLPYTPLHHLLFAEGLGPLVMTSANLAGQPLTYRDDDARTELGDVADAFLLHNREIFRPIDDSVVFTFRDEAVPLRRARGYAPRPIRLPVLDAAGGRPVPRILAVGGELKSTVCLFARGEAVLSEHLGDLTRPETFRHFVRAVDRLKELCGFEPELVACDLHPRYLATEYAQRLALPVVHVQHHHAHIASVMAEWGEVGPVVGLSCDGTGYGRDGAVWGCEVLLCERGECRRLGHLEYFPLVGGDLAALETWRPAAALLRAACGDGWRDVLLAGETPTPPGETPTPPGETPTPPSETPTPADALRVFEQQVVRGVNAPATSSLGRVFDAVGYLLGLCDYNRHEAEAAMAVEGAADAAPGDVPPFAYQLSPGSDGLRLSVLPTIRDMVAAREAGVDTALIAARFHETVARLLADAAGQACHQYGVTRVCVSGGCFANRRLLERLVGLLEERGLTALYHRQVPAGDGGIALGQAFVAAWQP